MRVSSSKLFPWALFLLCLLLLGSAATPLGPWADHLLIATRLALLTVVSVLAVRRKFRNETPRGLERGGFLKSVEHWYRGERLSP